MPSRRSLGRYVAVTELLPVVATAGWVMPFRRMARGWYLPTTQYLPNTHTARTVTRLAFVSIPRCLLHLHPIASLCTSQCSPWAWAGPGRVGDC